MVNTESELLDVLIVGAGPVGLACAIAAKRAGLTRTDRRRRSLTQTLARPLAHPPTHAPTLTHSPVKQVPSTHQLSVHNLLLVEVLLGLHLPVHHHILVLLTPARPVPDRGSVKHGPWRR